MSIRMECTVCMDVFSTENTPICAASCGHLFHLVCIQTWQGQGRRECPFCRTQDVDTLHLFPNFNEVDQREIEAIQLEMRTWQDRANSAQAEVDNLIIVQEQTRNQQRDIDRLRLQYDLLHIQNRIRVSGLMRDLERMQSQLCLAQSEIGMLKAQLNVQFFLELERNDLCQEVSKLTREQEAAKFKILQYQEQEKRSMQTGNMVSIRGFSEPVGEDPKRKLLTIFEGLVIDCSADDLTVLTCRPMTAHPDKFQVTIALANRSLKSDMMMRYQRLRETQPAVLQGLEFVDTSAISSFYKTVARKVYGRKGISALKLVEDQILIHVAGETMPREVVNDEQLCEVLELLPRSIKATPRTPHQQ